MSIYSRICLQSFLVAFLAIWVALQGVLWLTLVAVFLREHPYVPVAILGRVLPDLMVQALPLSLCFAVLLGVVLSSNWASRRQAYLWIEMAGGGLRQQVPIIGVGLVASVFLAWLLADVLPVATHRIRYLGPTSADTAGTLALRLAEHPGTLGGYRITVGGIAGAEMRDVAVVSRSPTARTMLAAQRASALVAPDNRELEIHLEAGRILLFDERAALQLNAHFGHLDLGYDTRRVSSESKRSLLSLNHYTNEELARVPLQYEELTLKGWPVPPVAVQRVAAVAQTAALRIQGALLPPLLLLLGVVFLARHIPAHRTRVAVGVVLLGAFVLLQYAILDVRNYRHGQVLPGWALFLPTIEVLVLCAARGFAGRFLRRVSHAR